MAKKVKASYSSKGERPSVSRSNKIKRTDTQKIFDKWNAFVEGRNVYFTVDNPNPNETNKRKIRVSGKDLYGDFRKYK